MKKDTAKEITYSALGIAVVCLGTLVIQIPIPLGYMHLGNACILLVSVFFGRRVGAAAGGIGSALADLLGGYPQWILPTLLIKGLMGFAVAGIAGGRNGRARMTAPGTLAASVAGILIMIAGYTVMGAILYGSLAAGLAQIPGLTFEGMVGIVLFYAAGLAFEASKLSDRFSQRYS